MKEKNNYKGITLIALVITIIVLLILAGVSIATLTGDNGILTQSTRAKEETRAGEVEEEINLWKSQKNGSNYIYWETEEEDELLDRLKNTGKIVEDEINRINKTITIGDRIISYKMPITLANGELGLDYEIVDNSILFLYPKLGGYNSESEYYYATIIEDDFEIGECGVDWYVVTTIKAGTHKYIAIGKDGQEVSITLTFKEENLPRYNIELATNYTFMVYDNKEQKYRTFDNAILELKRNNQEIFNKDVTENITTGDFSTIWLRNELRYESQISPLEILDAKMIIDGEEIQNKVSMPYWEE